MVFVNVDEAAARLEELIERIHQGEVVGICRDEVPVAQLLPLGEVSKPKRPIGQHLFEVTAPDSAFDLNEEKL